MVLNPGDPSDSPRAFIYLFIFNWRIIALQHWFHFCHTSAWITEAFKNDSCPVHPWTFKTDLGGWGGVGVDQRGVSSFWKSFSGNPCVQLGLRSPGILNWTCGLPAVFHFSGKSSVAGWFNDQKWPSRSSLVKVQVLFDTYPPSHWTLQERWVRVSDYLLIHLKCYI